jgi:hypothetical protein
MTTPSGQISLNDVNVELDFAGTTTIEMNQANVRTLAGVGGSGTPISMQNLQGKTNQFTFTISSNQLNANLRTLAVNAGWNQTIKVVATINAGVWVYSNSTGTPGLVVNGSWPGGVELINNGNINGMGGRGGNGNTGSGSSGSAGGTALSVSSAISIRNNSIIAGGGGGGGGGAGSTDQYGSYPGGGGGGGRTGLANSAGGSGYSAGGPGTSSGPGAGGAGISGLSDPGGNGGGWGAVGLGAGGAAGAAVTGSSFITWLATGSRFGPIS